MKTQDFERLIIREEKPIDVIEELIYNEKLPLVLWGAGQVASEVKNYLKKTNIAIAAVWVDGICERMMFDDIPILSLDEIKRKYSKFNVILGHSKYDLGEDMLKREKQINRIFYLVSVAYGQYDNFDYEFVKEHMKHYYMVYQMLDDEQSRNALVSYINTRLNNNICYIKACMKQEQNYFQNDIFSVESDECYLDVGAFNGDSIRLFLENCEGKFRKIYAFEPDIENFKGLKAYIEAEKIKNVSLYNIGTWKEKDVLYFDEKGQESGVSSDINDIEIYVDTLDNILKKEPVSMIKINFRSGLVETLEGAKKILQNHKPKLAIVVGFDEWLPMKIPKLIKEMVPEYKLYLRYNRCFPACLTLYAKINGK